MKPIYLLAATFIRLYLRDRMAVMLSLALMVFMMVLFGSVMGDDQFQVTLPIAVLDQSHDAASRTATEAIGRDELLAVVKVGDESDMIEQIRRAHVIAGLEFRSGTPVRVITSGQLTRWQRIGLDRLRQVLVQAKGQAETQEFTVESRSIPVVKNRYIDFIFPGMLAMAIMQACLGSGAILLQANKDGILRQLRLAPVSSSQLLAGFVIGRLFVVLLHLVVLGLVAVLGFGAQILSSWSELLFVVTFGCITFMSMGMAMAVMSPSYETGNLMVQLVSLPMSFLCGVFLKLDQMPVYLGWLAKLLPLTYLANIVRGMINLGLPLSAFIPDIAVLAAWLTLALIGTAVSLRYLRHD